MRLIVVAVCALLVGLAIGAATGGVRAQETPTQYEYRGTAELKDVDLAAGWQVKESHVYQVVAHCSPSSVTVNNVPQGSDCRYESAWYFLLQRPRQ